MNPNFCKKIEDGIEAEQRRMNVHKFLDSMRPTTNLREMIQKAMACTAKK